MESHALRAAAKIDDVTIVYIGTSAGRSRGSVRAKSPATARPSAYCLCQPDVADVGI